MTVTELAERVETAAGHRRLPRRHPGRRRAAPGRAHPARPGCRRALLRAHGAHHHVPPAHARRVGVLRRSPRRGRLRAPRGEATPVRTRRCGAPASPPASRTSSPLGSTRSSHEFIALPRERRSRVRTTRHPVSRRPDVTPAVTRTVDTPRKPRLDVRYYKLFSASVVSNLGDGVGSIAYPVAGVGGHPQPAARRARRVRPTAAVARVHPARRRDHRSRRPPQGDGHDGRVPVRAHARRRLRRARPAGHAARPG